MKSFILNDILLTILSKYGWKSMAKCRYLFSFVSAEFEICKGPFNLLQKGTQTLYSMTFAYYTTHICLLYLSNSMVI